MVRGKDLSPGVRPGIKPIPIGKQKWPQSTRPVASIFCLTFNHKNFIEDALRGFLRQKTNFPVEIIVHDDASTDGTGAVVRKYRKKFPRLFKAILRKNKRHEKRDSVYKKNLIFGTSGDFIALCEGDDYWIDPRKLQKQVDYLQENPEVRLACTRYLERRKNRLIAPKVRFRRVVTRRNWAYPYSLSTATAVFRRKDLIEGFPSEPVKNCKDIFYWRVLLQEGDAHVLPDCTAVYRIHRGGVWSLKNKFQQSLSNLKTAASMLRHFRTNHSDIHAFYKGSLKDCLKYLGQARRHEVWALWTVVLESKPWYGLRVIGPLLAYRRARKEL